MRRLALFSLVPALAAAPLAAQTFEGTISLKLPMGGETMSDVQYLVRGEKTVILMTLPASAGPMAGKEMRMIVDNPAMTMTILIATELMGGKGIKMVTDLNKVAADAGKTAVTVKELHTSETIAGYKCDNFEVTAGKEVTVVCMSKDLGRFTFPGGNPMGGRGRGNGAPSWAMLFATHPGFPLKATDANGKTGMVVTGVKKGGVSSDEFMIPDGYMDMGGMRGMGGRGGGF